MTSLGLQHATYCPSQVVWAKAPATTDPDAGEDITPRTVGELRCWDGRSRIRETAKLDRASAGEGKRSSLQSRDE